MPPAGAAEEREESEQMEQQGDHRARIFSGFRADRSTTCSPDGVLAKDRDCLTHPDTEGCADSSLTAGAHVLGTPSATARSQVIR